MNLKQWLVWFFITQFLFMTGEDDGGGSSDSDNSDSDDSGDGGSGNTDDDSDGNGDDDSDSSENKSALDAIVEEEEIEIEEYTLELGETSSFSKEDLDSFVTEAEELGLNKSQAEKLLQSREELYSRASKEVSKTRETEQTTLRESLINDPVFGGEKFEASTKIMSLPVAQFGDDDFKAMLKSDVGNQPALARFLYNLGNAMKSDSFVGKGKIDGPKVEKSSLEKLYPSFYEEK